MSPNVVRPTAQEPRLRIAQVARHEIAPDQPVEFGLELPVAGSEEAVWSLPLRGWALGLEAAYFRLQLSAGAGAPTHAPVRFARPDVVAAHPDLPWARRCGFEARVNAAWLPRQFELEVAAVRRDEAPIPLFTISGERSSLPPQDPDAIQPIAVTTLGRSGSVWLSWILHQHPQIVAPRPYDYEPRVAAYFLELFRVMSDPESYLQALTGAIDGNDWWLGGKRELPHRPSDEGLEGWLGSGNVEEALATCTGRIESFYRQAAACDGRGSATHFVEKYPPNHFLQDLLWEIYPGMREVFLVRDFRDVACSTFAYSTKTDQSWTRPRGVTSDEEFIRTRLGPEAQNLADRWSRMADSAFLLRYEDLVSDSRGTITELFEYLGVESTPETVDEVLRDAAEQKGVAGQAGHGTSSSAQKSVGRWRNDLPLGLEQACSEAFAEPLAAFGYERE